jgi:uncharacterized Fe-S center protein
MSEPTGISRRVFLKGGALAVGGAALSSMGLGLDSTFAASRTGTQEKAAVFFTKDINVNGLLKVYSHVSHTLTGKIGIKLHSGEPNGPNLLPIEFIKGLQSHVLNSTIVECNVLYPGPRRTTEGHLETLKINGFNFCPLDIMDADGDTMLPVPGMSEFLDKYGAPGLKEYPFTPGLHLREIAVGKNLLNYDSLLVYTHFKGHTTGGFGGSLKNIAIGCASSQRGKRQVHADGWVKGPIFQERMAESAKGIIGHFGSKMAYVNVLKNLSVDCDCDAKGAPPKARDVGIMASTDILAVDKASVDMVYALPEAEKHDLVERIESRSGLRQLEYMEQLGMGNSSYELVAV